MDAKTIATKQFARGAFGSYKADDVDVFFQEVLTYVKKLEKEHDDLLRDLKILADKTEEYREGAEAVQEALVKAQKYGNKIINDAKIEAEEIDSAAKAKAQEIIQTAQEKAYTISSEAMEQTEQLIRDLKNKALAELNELKKKTAIERKTMEHAKVAASSFKADLFELYRTHLDLINRIPELEEGDFVPETMPQVENEEDKPITIEQELPIQETAAIEEAAEKSAEETEEESVEEAAEKSAEEAVEFIAQEPAEEAVPAAKQPEDETPQEKSEETASFESLFGKPEEVHHSAPSDPEQVTMELVMQAEEADTKQIETEGDTTVIPTQNIDGDKTPEDVRRTVSNSSRPVYGRKFTDLKFGSGK